MSSLVIILHLIFGGSLLNLELAYVARPATLITLGICLRPLSWCWDYRHMLQRVAFYMDSGDLNLGSHVCVASTLLTGLFLQPQRNRYWAFPLATGLPIKMT